MEITNDFDHMNFQALFVYYMKIELPIIMTSAMFVLLLALRICRIKAGAYAFDSFPTYINTSINTYIHTSKEEEINCDLKNL